MTQTAPGRTQQTREAPMFGRYRMLGRIAAGGMAEVWAAQLLAPGGFCKSMVIKRVLPELASNPQFLRMLMTEARVAARLSHTNICAVFELGEVEGEYYIAMEYLRGSPLTTLLKAGPLDPAAAIAIVAQACDGLHYAHDQKDYAGQLLGLVHRDVSPHNLFVTVDGIVKVLDFGIAKVDDGSSERTEAGKVKGKLAYMSPEQLAADPLDRRSDVWSLGCVLWELLSGRRLFAGGPAQTVDAIRNARVPLLAAAGVNLPQLDDVIARAICKKREWRYATAADFRKAMVDALAPTTPEQNAALAELVWERCGTAIRAQDTRFELGEPTDTVDDPSVVSRLPLKAGNTTQVSQEIYVQDGVDAPALSNVLDHMSDVISAPATAHALMTMETSRADTSPDLPSNIERPRSGKLAVVIALVAAATVVGMVAALVLRDTPRAEEAKVPSPAVAKAEPAPAPAPEAKVEPEPVPVPVPEAKVEPRPEPQPQVEAIKVDEPKADEPKPKRDEPRAKPRPKKERQAVVKPPPAKTTPPPPKPVPTGKGKLYVNAEPWATIYIDGAKIGMTPVVGESIPAGDHTLKAVTEDGRVKTMKIHVDAGGNVRKKVAW